MTISDAVWRFAFIFPGLVLVVGSLFALLGEGTGSLVHAVLLITSIYMVCQTFYQRNDRWFTKQEMWQLTGGILLVDIIFLAAFTTTGAYMKGMEMSVAWLGTAMIITALFHAGLILAFFAIERRKFSPGYGSQVEQ